MGLFLLLGLDLRFPRVLGKSLDVPWRIGRNICRPILLGVPASFLFRGFLPFPLAFQFPLALTCFVSLATETILPGCVRMDVKELGLAIKQRRDFVVMDVVNRRREGLLLPSHRRSCCRFLMRWKERGIVLGML